ncbi:MAG: hypothetical protein AB9836_04500 [Aminipila sp.]
MSSGKKDENINTGKDEKDLTSEKTAVDVEQKEAPNSEDTEVKENNEASMSEEEVLKIIGKISQSPELLDKFAGLFSQQPNVEKVIVSNADDAMVTIFHMDQCASGIDTPVKYGNGKIKKFRNFGEKWDISLKEFEQEFVNSPVASRLFVQRILIVGDNCPQEVRERCDLLYGEDDFLTPIQYKKLTKLSKEELCGIFSLVNMPQKELIVRKFAELIDGGESVDYDKVEALNEISKHFVEKGEEGMFAHILKALLDAKVKNY